MNIRDHYFYALKIPIEIKKELFGQCKLLKEKLPFKKWVHYEDYHITLAFLGSCELSQLHHSIQLVERAIQHETTFSLMISHFGFFGNKNSPRIFKAGVEKEPSLNRLRKIVYDACENASFQLDKRPFRPHITLARRWNSDLSFDLNHIQLMETITFQASEVVLYQTHLDQEPKYEEIKTFQLREK